MQGGQAHCPDSCAGLRPGGRPDGRGRGRGRGQAVSLHVHELPSPPAPADSQPSEVPTRTRRAGALAQRACVRVAVRLGGSRLRIRLPAQRRTSSLPPQTSAATSTSTPPSALPPFAAAWSSPESPFFFFFGPAKSKQATANCPFARSKQQKKPPTYVTPSQTRVS